MSQPLLVAVMTEYLQLEKGMRVLEVGTASGYQAALLAHIIGENGSVTTVEYDRLLAREAQSRVNNLGYTNITVYEGDGLVSIPGMKPFDRIISTACAKSIPPAWKEQLSGGGILVSPIGFDPQDASLIRAIKNDSTGVMDQDDKGKVNFFPLLSQEEGGFSHNDLRKLFRAKEALLGERAAMVALRPRDYIMICAMNEKVSYSDYVERVKIPKERWAEFIGENESRGY
jgi:protein-L-isoaspartate(D-aspartate) O-methyltransferase